jgi:L-amino acid N-acyltransferase YncA
MPNTFGSGMMAEMIHAIPTQRIDIRAARPGDGAAFAAIYAPFVTDSSISFEEIPPDAREMTARILAVTRTYPWLAAERFGEVVGYAYAHRHRERPAYRWSVETSIYMRQDARGMGFGTLLYQRLFNILTEHRYATAFAGITMPNDASVALHRSTAFTPVGVFHRIGYKHGRWHDVSWWERPLSRADAAPKQVIGNVRV